MRDDFFALFFAVLFHLILAVSYWLFLRNPPPFVQAAPQNYEVIEAELFMEPDMTLTPPPPLPPVPVIEPPPPPPPPPPVAIEEPDETAALALLELKKQDLAKIEEEAERKRIEEQKRKEEAERKRIEEQKRKEEAERKRAEDQKRKEEAERKRTEDQKRKEEAERKRAEDQKRKEEAERKRAEDQKRKEEAERKRKEAAAAAAAAKAQADAAAAAGQARTNQRMAQVLALVQQRVKQRWIRPPNTPNTLVCIIEVRLLPDGTVGSASVVKSSGNTAFDRSAEQAIRSASPLPVSISQNADVFDQFRHFRFEFKANQ